MDQNNKPLVIFISAVSGLLLLATAAAFWFYPRVKDSDQGVFSSLPQESTEVTEELDVMEWVRETEDFPPLEEGTQTESEEPEDDLVVTLEVDTEDQVIETVIPESAKKPVAVKPEPKPQAVTPPKPKVETPKTIKVTEHWIQVASYTDRYRAEDTKKMLEESGVSVTVFTKTSGDTQYYRVRIGPYSEEAEARKYLDWVHTLEGFKESYVTKVFVDKTL